MNYTNKAFPAKIFSPVNGPKILVTGPKQGGNFYPKTVGNLLQKNCKNFIGNLLGFQLWVRTNGQTQKFFGGRGTGPLDNGNFLQIQKKEVS